MSDDFDDFELDGENDLANVPTSSEPDAGTYLVSIAKMEKKARRDGNGNYINVQFKIEDVLTETAEKTIGRSVFDIFNLGTEALWKIKGLIIACRGEEGATGNRIPNLTNERLVLDAYIDKFNNTENLRTRKYRTAKKWVGLTVDCTAEAEAEASAKGDGAAAPKGDSQAEVEI